MQKDMGFEYAYIYGAICPERDVGEALVMSHVNSKVMQKHIDAISKCIPSDRHGALVMDRAPWHRSIKVPPNMTIIHLPSYSPECNPHENIWEYMKNNFLSNKVFSDFDHVMESCCEAWNKLCGEAGRIKSIGTREWASIN
jgi:transposase